MTPNPRTRFANRPRALRRCILELLGRRDRLTSHDLAAAAYGQRMLIRPGWVQNITPSQLVAVRRAVRSLVAKGRVEELNRYRRWKVFSLRRPTVNRKRSHR